MSGAAEAGEPVAEELMTVEEAADTLGVSTATVKRMAKNGDLRAEKVGRTWVIDASSVASRPLHRRSAGRGTGALDFALAIQHLRSQDLKDDRWVPDVLGFEDVLSAPDVLIASAMERLADRSFDPPTNVSVPKSPFFSRNAVDLSVPDRLAYHAVVASLAQSLEAELSESVFSARLSEDKRRFLKPGVEGWLRWKTSVLHALGDGSDRLMIETDVTCYFDFIKHELLLPEIESLTGQRDAVSSLREMLRTWTSTVNTGLPQGPDASRVLANFYFTPIDHAMRTRTTVHYFRYMDDIRLVGDSRAELIQALHVLDEECRRRGLALSTKKTTMHRGEAARQSLEDSTLDEAAYVFDSDAASSEDKRKHLRKLFRKAVTEAGEMTNARHARFSLYRLFKMRDYAVMKQVLERLESVAPLGWIVPAYLSPWLSQKRVQEGIVEFLKDRDRNTSEYLSAWVLAAMLDVPGHCHPDVIAYARAVFQHRDSAVYHRAIAVNVMALGQWPRDIQSIEELLRREHDPAMLRAGLVALARVARLNKAVSARPERVAGLGVTVKYLQGRRDLPSLIYSTKRTPVLSAKL